MAQPQVTPARALPPKAGLPQAKRPQAELPLIKGVYRGVGSAASATHHWCLDSLAGRLVEMTGGPATAGLTLAARLLLEAQTQGEPVAWITTQESLFFPPDLAATGIDLAALPIIRVERGLQAARAADTLLRSGSFALVVLDLGAQRSMSLAVQTRLASLARRHQSAVLAVTRRELTPDQPSLGSLVSLHVECERQHAAFDRFACELRTRKDKRIGHGSMGGQWRYVELCHGPDGLS